ncbi:MAG TPA: tetratricopeptide repeat protein [Vicingaceae bacterium]|jgi:Tfp pilus assembly protein PilF|nr:tetratricopeptide repeat protein [Vicingaceae bacterium]
MSLNIKSEDQFQLADLDIKDGYIERAYETLNNILKDNPSFGKAHNHLGWMYETKFQNFTKAEEHYKKALELSPEYTAVYYNYAILLSTQQRWDDLNQLLEKSQKVPGINKATILNEYGIMFEAIEEYDKAIGYYKDAARASVDNKTMDKYIESVERCQRKKTLF